MRDALAQSEHGTDPDKEILDQRNIRLLERNHLGQELLVKLIESYKGIALIGRRLILKVYAALEPSFILIHERVSTLENILHPKVSLRCELGHAVSEGDLAVIGVDTLLDGKSLKQLMAQLIVCAS